MALATVVRMQTEHQRSPLIAPSLMTRPWPWSTINPPKQARSNSSTMPMKHYRISVTLSLLLTLSSSHAQIVSDGMDVPLLAGFDQAMLLFMQQRDIPDAQLAITWQGRLVLARSYDNDSTNPADNQTRFRIASVSKSLTSTLLHRLQQDGVLSMDDSISDYLDLTPAPGDVADPALEDITIRNLLQHLAGISSTEMLGYDPVFNDAAVASALGVELPILKSQIRTFMNGKSLATAPGTNYAYSNYGYLLAGQVIESATGLPYGAYADSVFNPIGIYIGRQARSERHRLYDNEAVAWSGYQAASVMDSSGDLLPYEYGALNYENSAAFGGWTIPAVELAKWMASLDAPGDPDAILNQDSLDQMFGLPENLQRPFPSGDYYYAAGWAVRDYGTGGLNTWHGGSLPGTTSYVVRIRDGFSFVALFNRRNETAPGTWIAALETAIFNARAQVSSWPQHDLFAQSLRPAPAQAGARYSGSWFDQTHNGEGFVIQVINADTAVIYWFTYDRDGQQRWYFGIAQLDGHRMIIRELLQSSGGQFGPAFDPSQVETSIAGSLVINFYDDGSAKADYLLHGDSGYMELSRLSTPFANDDPATAGDWRNGLWYDPAHNGEGFVVEVLADGRVVAYWFTFDDQGNPAWMIGTLQADGLDQGIDLMMNRPEEGNFGVAFDPSRVVVHPNGVANMTLGCQGPSQVIYSGGDAGFPEVTLSLVRLAGYTDSACP